LAQNKKLALRFCTEAVASDAGRRNENAITCKMSVNFAPASHSAQLAAPRRLSADAVHFTIHFPRVDAGDDSSQARKVFFSEEKKQKTFIFRPWPGCMEAMAGQ
jgi:hypothetical protein